MYSCYDCILNKIFMHFAFLAFDSLVTGSGSCIPLSFTKPTSGSDQATAAATGAAQIGEGELNFTREFLRANKFYFSSRGSKI